MKHYKFGNEAEYQEKLNPKEQDTKDYFSIAMKQKKEEKIHTVIVFILIVLSLIGTCMGVYNLIKLSTTFAYLILGTIVIPLTFVFGGIIFLAFKKETETHEKDKTITFVSVNFIVSVVMGICIGVFYLIDIGTILAYIVSAIIICVVLYYVIKTVKNQMRKKTHMPYR